MLFWWKIVIWTHFQVHSYDFHELFIATGYIFKTRLSCFLYVAVKNRQIVRAQTHIHSQLLTISIWCKVIVVVVVVVLTSTLAPISNGNDHKTEWGKEFLQHSTRQLNWIYYKWDFNFIHTKYHHHQPQKQTITHTHI